MGAAGEDDAWMGSPSARDSRFEQLRVLRDRGKHIVAFEFVVQTRPPRELSVLWQSLPPFPYLFECVTEWEHLLLRFAAINWAAPRIELRTPEDVSCAATAGVALCRAFELIQICVTAQALPWFTCPFVKVDLEGRPRAGFLAPRDSPENLQRLPPEVAMDAGATNERSLVYAVGQLVLDLVVLPTDGVTTPLGDVIARAMRRDPQRRYSTLAGLRSAFVAAGGRRNTRDSVTGAGAWDDVECGIGFLLAERWTLARGSFARALVHAPLDARARRGWAISSLERDGEEVTDLLGVMASIHRETTDWLDKAVRGPATRSWADIEPLAKKLEADHDPRAALSLYRSVKPEPTNGVYLGLARTSLALGDTGYAIDYARRARLYDPSSRETFRIEATALLRRRQHPEALACTGAWAAVAPDDGPLHYVRGKALLGLSRLPEARDAFDRASVLEPTMIEAMLLRREVDRHMKRQRSVVGAQAQAALVFPPELAGFRDAMVSGHVVEAIALLRTARYADDALAQILLAQLLAFDGEHAEALAIFLRYVDGEQRRSALVGAAECCLALGHSEEALAAANRLDPRKEVVAIELRARAFAQLGRDAEAEAELQRYVAANRGDVRVRNARR